MAYLTSTQTVCDHLASYVTTKKVMVGNILFPDLKGQLQVFKKDQHISKQGRGYRWEGFSLERISKYGFKVKL